MLTVRHLRGTFRIHYAGDLPDPEAEKDKKKKKGKAKKNDKYPQCESEKKMCEGECPESCHNECKFRRRVAPFREWLKLVFQPSHQRIFGEYQMNPVIFFHITKLSPGYVGGLISCLTYT